MLENRSVSFGRLGAGCRAEDDERVLKNIIIDISRRKTTSSLSFIFLPIRAIMPLNLPSKGTFWPDHRPRPSFSFSA